MSIWKISTGGYLRFDKATSKYVKVQSEDKNNLNDFLKENFNVELCEIKLIKVIDEFTHYSLTIIKNNNESIQHMYDETKLPKALIFYKYNFVEIENNTQEYSLTISTGSVY